MYRVVLLARAIDVRMWILNRAGKAAFVISGQGHEGAQVGVTFPLRQGSDWLVPYYRSIAAALIFGMTPRELMLAQFAKASDPSSGGRQMPGHYGHAPKQILSVSSPVATQVPQAVGIALAAKIRGTGQVALASLGEGSTSQGDFHEGLNFAGIHRLPVVFLVENNGYAISVPMALESAVPDIASRAAAYGFPGVVVDGTDVLACYAAGREAIDRARRGDGPTLIEAKVTRLTGHSSDDQQTRYRSAEELAEALRRDPLVRFREQLREAGVLDGAREDALNAEVRAIVDDATDWAEAQPDPDPATATRHVYADAAT
jgi:2-oxoisovalerate dehydrogenase E1 component alpha subunit